MNQTLHLKSALDDYTQQKKELSQLKKQEQEMNLQKHRRVQSAYKKILIDKIKEKGERSMMLYEKKEKAIQIH